MSVTELSFREQYLSELNQNGFLSGNGKWNYQICDCLKKSDHDGVFLVELQDSNAKAVLKVSDGTVDLENEFSVLQCLGNRENLHVPAPIAFWREEGKQYMLRQLIEGSTLQELHDEYGDLSETQVRHIGALLCDELHQLHRRGLIHRDIKPENVVLTASGNAFLIDLGTMRVYQRNARGGDTLCLGTKEYAAPEQYGYQQSDVPTDVYAMGKLLLYLLTGSTELETLDKAHISRAMKSIIRRCTVFDPQKRIRSMKLLRHHLDGSEHK